MTRYTTDHPSDPDRARIQAASDRCSRETMNDEPEENMDDEHDDGNENPTDQQPG